MKTLTLQSNIQQITRLQRELQADGQLGPLLIAVSGGNGQLLFEFDDAFDSADETYLRFTFLTNFVDVNNDADFQPKIIDFAITDAKKKDFRNIDYNKEVTQYWYRTDLWGQGSQKGLLLGVDYFSDEQKTDLVLKVRVIYVQDAFGNLVSKQTARTWVNRNGTDNDEVKGHDNVKVYTPLQSRNATDRRRRNIIKQLEGDLIGLLLTAAGDDPEQQGLNLNLGVEFLTFMANEIDIFYKSGNPANMVSKIQEQATIDQFPFLLLEVAPGYTAQQFIIDGVTY